ncbi:hypothetical protein JAAARDRAFT_610667 [Jaapia argillacea MUCL 33604]|uniref:Uncharacterized protein n=1 Tax=Jaapia argillacea MUCL 33604 TaxID=933084 RepID=A0A067PHN0_9AGAM|nr:hypothetical protein JAAARDRAFT_610667 [Jaapia argillacea MUCL 33604]
MAVPLTLSLSFSILTYLFVLSYGALAQLVIPDCVIPSAQLPLVNSRGQDLCFIAHTAWGMCTGNWAWGSNLTTGYVYTPPSDGCQCTVVLYNLVSSCAWCQGGSWTTWPGWSVNCTASQFTQIIPLNATVPYPNWAYVYSDSDMFNASVAAAVGGKFSQCVMQFPPQLSLPLDQPESSTVPPPSSTSTVASSTTSSTLSSSSSVTHSSTSSPSSTAVTKKTTNAGPIAGGVVAGVVAIAAACGVLLWYMRRKKQATETHPSTSATPTLPPLTMSQKQYTYYDPNDPNTFPKSPATTTTGTYVGSPIRMYEPSPIRAGAAYSPTQNGSHPGLPELY